MRVAGVLATAALGHVLCTAIWLAAMASADDVPRGHLRPLGAHRKPEKGIAVVVGFPPAREFFERFVAKKTPVVMRGAADGWPARAVWTDDYLRKLIGRRRVEV